MYKKETYYFGTKKKYREELKKSILEQFPFLKDSNPKKRKKIKDFRVLCLPGHEGLEVELYQSLGISPKNIFCVERNPTAAREFKNNPNSRGVELYAGELTSFLEQATLPQFQVANLDFQGHFDLDEDYIISLLCGRQLLTEKSLLGTNFLGKREANLNAIYTSALISSSKFQSIIPELLSETITKDSIQRIKARTEKAITEIQSKEKSEIRSKAITSRIWSLVNNGQSIIEVPSVLLDYFEQLKSEFSPEFLTEIKLNEYIQANRNAKTFRDRYHATRSFFNFSYYGLLFQEYITHSIYETQESNKIKLTKNGAFTASSIVFAQIIKSYFVKECNRGSYISDTGSRMLYDFFSLIQLPNLSSELRLLRLPSGELTLPKISDKSKENIAKQCHTFMTTVTRRNGLNILPRIYLGSSYKPKPKVKSVEDIRDLITLEDALDFMASGCPKEDIVECFRFEGFTLDDLILTPKEKIKEELLDPPIGTYPLASPLRVKPILTTKAEVKEAIASMYQLFDGNLTTTDICAVYDLDNSLIKSVPAFIAHETMRKERSKENKKYLELIGDVASILGSSEAQKIFGLPTWQKAAAQLGVRRFDGEVAFIEGADLLFKGPKNTRRRLSVLSKEHGSYEKIPSSEYEKFNIEVYQVGPGSATQLI